MESPIVCQNSSEYQLSSFFNWHTLYRQLTITVTRWVRSVNLPTWKSQREGIIDEIVQETMMKVLKRIRREESGELPPVYSVEGLCVRVANNVFIDMVRHNRQLVPLASDSWHEAPYDISKDEHAHQSYKMLLSRVSEDVNLGKYEAPIIGETPASETNQTTYRQSKYRYLRLFSEYSDLKFACPDFLWNWRMGSKRTKINTSIQLNTNRDTCDRNNIFFVVKRAPPKGNMSSEVDVLFSSEELMSA